MTDKETQESQVIENHFQTEKQNLAVWEYRNSDEEVDRFIALNVDGLLTASEEDRRKILGIMDMTIKALAQGYNFYLKDKSFGDNVLKENTKQNLFTGNKEK